jgi:hypothetical protein
MTSPQWDHSPEQPYGQQPEQPYGQPEQPYGEQPPPPPQPNLPVPVSGELIPASQYQQAPYYQQQPILMTIGDISITQNQVIIPTGRYPLRGTTWTMQDSSQPQSKISTAGIILAIVSVVALCGCGLLLWPLLLVAPFGLLFLLMKEHSQSGFISVTVTGQGLFHAVQFPPGPQSAAYVTNQVNQARSLAAVG